jgi:hypothetical protein
LFHLHLQQELLLQEKYLHISSRREYLVSIPTYLHRSPLSAAPRISEKVKAYLIKSLEVWLRSSSKVLDGWEIKDSRHGTTTGTKISKHRMASPVALHSLKLSRERMACFLLLTDRRPRERCLRSRT